MVRFLNFITNISMAFHVNKCYKPVVACVGMVVANFFSCFLQFSFWNFEWWIRAVRLVV